MPGVAGTGLPRRSVSLAAALVLGCAVVFAYLPTLDAGFSTFDDDYYVRDNPQVLGGLTVSGVRWSLTSFTMGNWHPLTWLSHMADVELFGVDARGHRLVNILLHLAAATGLGAAFLAMTGALWPSLLAGGLIALHPQHVEAAAWISERKEVLAGVFWAVTLGCYARYVRCRTPGRYLLLTAAYCLGLAAKPTLVTLPAALLLLDFWPLGRVATPGRRGEAPAVLLLEKAPLLALAAAAAVTSYIAQGTARFLAPESLPFATRLANALLSALTYLEKTVVPTGLGVFYPYPAAVPLGRAVVAGGLLAAALAAALLGARKRPHLTTGALWFLLTLLPVIGLVQAGAQAMADRYSYVPHVGLFAAMAWELRRIAQRSLVGRRVAVGAAALGLVLLTGLARHQAGYWKSDLDLFRHTLAVAGESSVVRGNLGLALARSGRLEEAIAEYRRALALDPGDAGVLNNLGVALGQLGRLDEAVPRFRAAIRLDSRSGDPQSNLGIALERLGRKEEALAWYREALRLRPDHPRAADNLRRALAENR